MPGRLSPERRPVDRLLAALDDWARERRDVRAVALVGSWASGEARADSDVDVIVLTDAPELYAATEDWAAPLGAVGPLTTRLWGAITERRFRLAGGLEVEVGIGRPSWAASDPVDPGTRRVVEDGLTPVSDPGGLLAALLESASPRGRHRRR